jgi:hypothetical protein
VSEVPKHITFDEYWKVENELWGLSMKESFRQRDERIKKLNEQQKNKTSSGT